MYKFFKTILVFILFYPFTGISAQYYKPVYEGFPYSPMSILITSVSIDTSCLSIGDEIGIFDGNLCVGSVVYNGSMPIDISASLDDPTTPEKDGYTYNNSINFRFWNTNLSIEYKSVSALFDTNFNMQFKPYGTAFVSLKITTEKIFKIEDQSFIVLENSPKNSKVGALVASCSKPVNFRILYGPFNGIFELNPETGCLYVLDKSRLDYESNKTISLKIKMFSILDSTIADTAKISVLLENIDEPPVGNSITSDTVYANNRYNKLLAFIDSEGQNVTISPISLPVWMEMQTTGNGQIELRGTPELRDTGIYEVSISVSDGMNNSTYSYPINIKSNLSSLKIKNNPSNGDFSIELEPNSNDDVQITVRQLNGAPIYTQKISNVKGKFEFPVNLVGKPKNFYLLEVKIGNTISSNKLILQ